jgi:hypothetical protein
MTSGDSVGGLAVLDAGKFVDLGQPRRVWAVGAVRARVVGLRAVHAAIVQGFQPGDRVVYLGTLTGFGDSARETYDELLTFRRTIMALRGVIDGDLVYLRGAQEEMLHKLLQLQFAPDPPDVLAWMLDQGVAPTIRAYGSSLDEARIAARNGPVAITRWTNALRQAIRQSPGHQQLFNAIRRAAIIRPGPAGGGVLFVNANIDRSRPLTGQADAFWWGGARFHDADLPFDGFDRIVRGHDPRKSAVRIDEHVATIDASGATVACVLFAPDGHVLHIVAS